METFSTREAARRLGLDVATLSRYITAKKVPTPKLVQVGKVRLHMWTAADIERVRQILPKIANGRKTRYQKQTQKDKTKKSKH